MQFARFLGILVVFGVLAIMGGGLVYHLFHTFVAVWIYEALLLALAIKVACKACCHPAPSEH
ncbi:MAG: hypothetical protein SWQ30_18935 [Thermodesulfobacteriota bacterium]|nr:hypothetical protein [Thermodesulfobacteriota bacterium]